jgi:hypothetical protein
MDELELQKFLEDNKEKLDEGLKAHNDFITNLQELIKQIPENPVKFLSHDTNVIREIARDIIKGTYR